MKMRVGFAAPFVLTAALAHADPPKAKKGQPVYQDGAQCYTYGRAEVQCPPNLVLADPSLSDHAAISFDPSTLSCTRVPELECPSEAKCNPPAPQPTACPAKLLPHLARKVKPTRRKGKACYYGKVKVVCP